MADEAEQATAPEPELAGIEAQRRRIKARKAAPPLAYDCPHSGLRYTFRLADGTDVEHALDMAKDAARKQATDNKDVWDGHADNDTYLMALTNRLSIEPKITVEFWRLLGQDAPGVRNGLSNAFLRPSGLLPGALAEAKKPSGETAS